MASKLVKKPFLRELRCKISKKIKDRGVFYFIFFALKELILFFVVFCIYIFICLIKPIVFMRVGSFSAGKIGNLVADPELYLCEKDHNIQPQNTLDIFHDGLEQNPFVSNDQLLRMWKRVFSSRRGVLLANNGIVKKFYKLSNRFSFGGDHIIKATSNERDLFGLIEKSETYLKFTEEEIVQAKLGLQKMGIKDGAPYVCMLNRDQRYLCDNFPEMKLDYHSFRNFSIKNYMLAAEELTKRGFYVIRMGVIVDELMDTDNPKIIEYADRGFRTDLLDLYLSANCYLFLSCNTGADALPMVFHRPQVFVNISDFERMRSWCSNCLIIFKKYWLKKEKRFMTIAETLRSGAGALNRTEEYENMGIELIENTREETLDVVDEMDQRLKGTWQTTQKDEDLQARFWSYFKPNNLHYVIRSRIGAKFLRQHKEWLGLSDRATK